MQVHTYGRSAGRVNVLDPSYVKAWGRQVCRTARGRYWECVKQFRSEECTSLSTTGVLNFFADLIAVKELQ